MTSASVISKIKQELDDQGVFYTDTDIYDSLQDGYHEIALRTSCIEKIVSVAPPIAPYWNLADDIPDYFSIFAIYNRNERVFLTPASVRSIENMNYEWETQTGTPQYFIPIDFKYIALYPTYSATPTYNFYVFYFGQAPDFTSSNTLSLPSNTQTCIEDYVVNDLLDQSLEFNKSKIFYGNYVEGINRTKKQLEGRNVRDRIKHFLVTNHVSLDR